MQNALKIMMFRLWIINVFTKIVQVSVQMIVQDHFMINIGRYVFQNATQELILTN